MTIDSRLLDIARTSDDRDPNRVADDQIAVILDNLMAAYWRDPQKTDSMLRRDGHIRTAERLVEVFGPQWWERMPIESADS